jgi:hypothetical protein
MGIYCEKWFAMGDDHVMLVFGKGQRGPADDEQSAPHKNFMVCSGGVWILNASKDNDDDNDLDLTIKSPTSLQETLARIQLDNDRSYFLSGKVDTLIYDPDCIFSDPFISFRGRDHFVDHLANLGSFTCTSP